jgi:glyoxylase-like metal-dependent hydrolase (beta-lactamase superfamily II)
MGFRAPRRLIAEGTNLTLDLGNVVLEVAHAGTTHTRGSLTVSVRPDNVTFAGDILYGGRLPAILSDSNITGWLSAYQRLSSLAERTFVPGHGQPAPLRAFDHSTLGYLSALKRHMDQEVKAGASIDNAVNRFDARPWQSLENFSELARRNAYNAFLESEADF